MRVPFLDLTWQHKKIDNSLHKRWQEVINNTSFVLGPELEEFENNFAKFLGIKHTIGVASGTDALILIFKALDLKPDDEVITIPTTFLASVSAVIHAGAKPVFVDIDPNSRGFDFSLLEKAINDNTKVIMPVHLYGQPEDMDKILAIAEKYNLIVVEDACQAHGAEFKNKKVGSFSKLSAFSFYPGKNLGAYGEAGAVVTDDDELAIKITKLRNHGGIKKYEHEILGFNSRLDSLQAVVLDEKLKLLDEWNETRIKIAKKYDQGLGDIKQIKIFSTRPNTKAVYHLYIVQVLQGDRNEFVDYLKDNEIGAGIHYPEALHLLPALKNLGYKPGDFSNAEKYSSQIVSLPIFPGMTEQQTEYVINKIKEYFK